MLGGTYLAYEGVHKIYHKLFHKKEDEQEKEELKKAFRDEEVDMVEFEKKKINGAIRTDFILSAEIIVLALGAVKTAELAVQLGVLTAIGFGVVVVVYGLVAGIVKIDDLGLKLREKGGAMETIGDALVAGSPKFMKGLGIVGTVAMLLVGGGIYAHNIEPLHHVIKEIAHAAGPLEAVLPMVANGLVGLVVGAVALPVVGGFMKVTGLGGDGH
jgi:hypothetical protein